MNKKIINKSVIILLIVIAVYSMLCLSMEQSGRLTGDAMLYVSIAHKYLAGDFQNAINGYWGPLLAWLFAPLLYAGISDILAIKLLNLLFGVLTFIGIWYLSFRFEMRGVIRNTVLIASLPIVLKFSLVQPMDFLLVSILIVYMGIIFKTNYYKRVTSGLSCGFLGSLAYLTKAYAYPFFIVHFFVINVLHYLANSSKEIRKKVLKNTIAGSVLFFLISGIWIMTISNKYGYFTFSTMRSTNFNAPGPDVKGEGLEFGVPVFTEGFYEPPNETAFVIWEDPSYLRGNPWSAWQSKAHFIHFIKLTLKNIAEGLKIFESFSSFSLIIIVAYILFLITRSPKELLSKMDILNPLFTLVLFSGGYVLLHFEPRYVWLSNVLLLLMGGHLLSMLFQQSFFKSNARKNILLVFFLISFIFAPSRFVIQTGNYTMDQEMYDLSIELKQYNVKGNFASNRHAEGHEPWHKTFRLAYWLNSNYYGQRGENFSDSKLSKELKKYNIDYYFIWGKMNKVPDFLMGQKEVLGGNVPSLKIYSIGDFLL